MWNINKWIEMLLSSAIVSGIITIFIFELSFLSAYLRVIILDNIPFMLDDLIDIHICMYTDILFFGTTKIELIVRYGVGIMFLFLTFIFFIDFIYLDKKNSGAD
jgi:hypothetical protein